MIVPAIAVIVLVTGAIGALANPPLAGLLTSSASKLLVSSSLNGRHDWREQKQRLSKLNGRWIVSALEAPTPTEALICVVIADAPR